MCLLLLSPSTEPSSFPTLFHPLTFHFTYFPPHPSYIPFFLCFSLFLSLCAMVGGEWVCGGLICSLKRHASPSNASCRSFPSSFYPSPCLLQWEIVMHMFNLRYCLCLPKKGYKFSSKPNQKHLNKLIKTFRITRKLQAGDQGWS